MISEADYSSRDATALAGLVRRGDASPTELLEAAIARIDRLNPDINAVVETLYDLARQDIEAGLPDGPFTGVPFLVKDLHTLVRGSRLSHGCRFFADHVSTSDSAIIAKAREAGLVVIGRTNTPEFGLNSTTESAFLGVARNPWDQSRSAGGSSGGSAASVASGMVPMSHATDSGGSTRIPASCCGMVGLKPTRGRVFAGLDIGEGWHDTFHAFAVTRSVRDTAGLLDCLQNRGDPAPSHAPGGAVEYTSLLGAEPKPYRIGILADPPSGAAVDPQCQAALFETASLQEDLGHRTEACRLRFDTAEAGQAFTRIISSTVAATVGHWERQSGRRADENDFEASVWNALGIGRSISGGELNAANACIHLTARNILRQLSSFDIILSPTVANPPLPLGILDAGEGDIATFLGKVFAFAPFTSMYNITGQPAISLPVSWNPDGLPLGIQAASAPGREDILIEIAEQLEEATGWKEKQDRLIARYSRDHAANRA